MGISKTLSYNLANSGNYVADSNKIDFLASLTQLKRPIAAGSPFVEDATDDTDWTYVAADTEFVAGMFQQKDKTQSGSVMAVSYPTDANPITTEADLNWHKSGSTSAVLNGAPVITSGKLVCTGTQGAYYVKNMAAVETLAVKWTAPFSGTAPNNINILGNQQASGNVDRFILTLSPSGANTWRFTLNDSSGATVIAIATAVGAAGWTPTSGTEYDIRVVLNSSAGTVQLYIDNVLYGTSSPGVWTRGTGTARYYVGAMPNIYNTTEGSYDDGLWFDSAVASLAKGYSVVSTIYAASLATLPTFSRSGLGTIDSLTGFTSTEGGAPRWIVGGKYWNGSDWVTSDDSYAQASTASDVNTNISSHPDINGTNSFVVKIVFDDSNTQSTFDNLSIANQGDYLYDQTDPSIVETAGQLMDGLDSFAAVVGETGSDTVTFILNVDGQDMYWDGAAWSNSDCSVAQSNTAADIETNKAALDLSTGKTVKVKALLHSDDGSSTPTITSVTLEYNFFISTPSAISKCIMYGWRTKSNGDAIVGETVKAAPEGVSFNSEFSVSDDVISTTTDSSGYWELSLSETATEQTLMKFVFEGSTTGSRKEYNGLIIPNQSTKSFHDLVAGV